MLLTWQKNFVWFGLWTLKWASAIHICSHMIKHIIRRMFYHSPQSCQWQIACRRILEAQFKINENHVALTQRDGWKVNPLKNISKPHLHWHHFYKILSHYADSTLDSSMLYSQTFFFSHKILIAVELQAVTGCLCVFKKIDLKSQDISLWISRREMFTNGLLELGSVFALAILAWLALKMEEGGQRMWVVPRSWEWQGNRF